jgi:hypothetical protein
VALDAGHIDASRARLLLWPMRQIASDIRFIEQQKALRQGGTTTRNVRSAAGDKSSQHYQIPIRHSNSITYERNMS